jgi:hypothetical protein
MKWKKITEEKVEEWEVKSHVHWPSLTPHISLFTHSLSFVMGILAKRGITKESHEIIIPDIAEIKRQSPFESSFPIWVSRVKICVHCH